MKLFSILISLFLVSAIAYAQVPQAFNYQAIARDSKGKILDSEELSVRIRILNGSAEGLTVYEELHSTKTNDIGLFHLLIGQGESTSGEFAEIEWAEEEKYLEIAIDYEGKGKDDEGDRVGGLSVVGTVQLLSVPYALYAEKSGGDIDHDMDSTNEIQQLSLVENELTIEGGNTVTLPSPTADHDSDSTNEIQDLELNGNILTITKNGLAQEINLSIYIDDSVTSDEIVDGTVVAKDISLASSKIFVGNAAGTAAEVEVTGDISLDNTGKAEIANNTVTAAEIKDGEVGTAELADDAVTAAKIAPGAITINDLLSPQVEQVLSINPAAFRTDHSTYSYAHYGYFIGGVEGDDHYAYAPIYLPQGAIIKRVEAGIKDSNPTYDLDFDIYANPYDDQPGKLISHFGSTGSAGVQVIIDDDLDNNVIDNENNSYWMLVYAQTTSTDVRLYSFKIVYSLSVNQLSVQERLNQGETPLSIYQSNHDLLDSLYGKTYQGGLIFYFDTSNGSGLVVTPNDLGQVEWGCLGTAISGADGSAIGTGEQNTQDIIAECSQTPIAAELCADLSYNTFDDWYLPSKDELNQIWIRSQALEAAGDDFVNGIGYWSSTEVSATLAWPQDLSSGFQHPDGNGKNDLYFVRGVRGF